MNYLISRHISHETKLQIQQSKSQPIRIEHRNAAELLVTHFVTEWSYIVFASQTLESVKMKQIEKFHKAKSDFERDSIELDPTKILHLAVDNCKPLLMTKRVHRGGVVYQV